MTRTDTVIVGTLVALLAILAGLISVPAIQLASAPATGSPSPGPATPGFEVRPYVEGVVGRPESVSPLTAKTHVSRIMAKLHARDRVHLVVVAYESGLVAPGWQQDPNTA